MKTTAQHVFVRRVEYALTWAILIGLTASLNLVPSQQRSGTPNNTVREVVTTHPMVVPRQPLETQPQPQPQPSQNLSPQLRVHMWFARFDDIRERAKMSPMEKANALRLWASSFATTSESDKEDARRLMSSLAQRYTRASAELGALKPIPETKQLQNGYAKFFAQAKANFQSYVTALDHQSTKAVLNKMSVGRQQLASIDVRNKSLDRHLRQRYGIKQID